MVSSVVGTDHGDQVYVSVWKKNFVQDDTLRSSRLFVTCKVEISCQPNAPPPITTATTTASSHKPWPRSSSVESNYLPQRFFVYEASHSFRFQCNSFSCPDFDDSKAMSTISEVISDMDIPFSLENTQWRTNCFGQWTPLNSKDNLIKQIVEFSHLVVGESWTTTTHREYRMHVNFEKNISLPIPLYEAMVKKNKEKNMMLDLKDLLVEAAWTMRLSKTDLEDMAQDVVRKEGGMTLDKSSLESLIQQIQRRTMVLRNSLSELTSRKLKTSKLDLLEIVKVDGATIDEMEACSICLQIVELGSFVSRMPNCSHMFHPHCIYKFLLRNQSCPLCCFPLSS